MSGRPRWRHQPPGAMPPSSSRSSEGEVTVISSACDLRLGHGPCMICGDSLRYPYLEWHTDKQNRHIVICGRCCQKVKKGFVADLIQVAASMEGSQQWALATC